MDPVWLPCDEMDLHWGIRRHWGVIPGGPSTAAGPGGSPLPPEPARSQRDLTREVCRAEGTRRFPIRRPLTPWPRTLASEKLIHGTAGIAADTDAGQRRAGGTSGELVSRPATETRTDESPEQGWLEPHTLPHTLSRSALLAGQGVLVRSRERRWACRIRISRRGGYIVSARGQATPPADV